MPTKSVVSYLYDSLVSGLESALVGSEEKPFWQVISADLYLPLAIATEVMSLRFFVLFLILSAVVEV